MAIASGQFDVTRIPAPLSEAAADSGLGRHALVKRYHGALDATGSGEMLSAMGAVQGSAAYVALERVDGALDGRSGSFVLHHSGSMTRGQPSLLVCVVPDSATGALAGLQGTLAIRIEEGRHFYDFEYSFAS